MELLLKNSIKFLVFFLVLSNEVICRFRDVESDTEAEIETVFIHPSYETTKIDGALKVVNDIALIKLKNPVKLDQFIQPACLPYRF